MITRFVLFLVAGLLISCGNNKKTVKNEENIDTKNVIDPISELPPAPAPGTAHVAISLDSLQTENSNWSATVTIVSVEAYGSTTPHLTIGDSIEVNISQDDQLLTRLNSLETDEAIGVVLSHKMTRSGSEKPTWTITSILN